MIGGNQYDWFKCSKQYPQLRHPHPYPQPYPDPFAPVSQCQQIADMVNNYANSMYRRNLNATEKRQCKAAGGKLVLTAVNINKPNIYGQATKVGAKGIRCGKCPAPQLYYTSKVQSSPFIQSMIA